MDQKNKRLTVQNKNFVPYERLTDVPSRLFRNVTEALNINLAKWKTYMDDYLRWIHPDDGADPQEVKKQRSTTFSNIQSALFFSNSLTWNKLLMALKISKVVELEITFKIKTESGEEHIIKEITNLPRKNFNDDSK